MSVLKYYRGTLGKCPIQYELFFFTLIVKDMHSS